MIIDWLFAFKVKWNPWLNKNNVESKCTRRVNIFILTLDWRYKGSRVQFWMVSAALYAELLSALTTSANRGQESLDAAWKARLRAKTPSCPECGAVNGPLSWMLDHFYPGRVFQTEETFSFLLSGLFRLYKPTTVGAERTNSFGWMHRSFRLKNVNELWVVLKKRKISFENRCLLIFIMGVCSVNGAINNDSVS